MPAIEVRDLLPPAITLPHEVIDFAVSQHLEEFGKSSLVARTWSSTEADQARSATWTGLSSTATGAVWILAEAI